MKDQQLDEGRPAILAEMSNEREVAEALSYAEEIRKTRGTAARLTQEEKNYKFALKLQEHAERELEWLLDERRSLKAEQEAEDYSHHAIQLEARLVEIETQIRHFSRELCIALRDQGRLEEALAADPSYVNQIAYGLEAIQSDDTALCDCEDDTVNGLVLQAQSIKKRMFSAKHGKFVYLVTCRKCGFKNATPILPDKLARMEAARSSGMPDKIALSCRNLTTE